MMPNKYTTNSWIPQDDYFSKPATAELIQNYAIPLSPPTSQNVSTTEISSVPNVNGLPYQQRAHSVVIKRYAIKRA